MNKLIITIFLLNTTFCFSQHNFTHYKKLSNASGRYLFRCHNRTINALETKDSIEFHLESYNSKMYSKCISCFEREEFDSSIIFGIKFYESILGLHCGTITSLLEGDIREVVAKSYFKLGYSRRAKYLLVKEFFQYQNHVCGEVLFDCLLLEGYSKKEIQDELLYFVKKLVDKKKFIFLFGVRLRVEVDDFYFIRQYVYKRISFEELKKQNILFDKTFN